MPIIVRRPYNRLVLIVVQEAIRGGANPHDIFPGAGHWLIAWGHHSTAEILRIPQDERAGGSSGAESQFFFTGENELMRFDGKTYALLSVFGQEEAEDAIERIIDQFNLGNIAYERGD